MSGPSRLYSVIFLTIMSVSAIGGFGSFMVLWNNGNSKVLTDLKNKQMELDRQLSDQGKQMVTLFEGLLEQRRETDILILQNDGLAHAHATVLDKLRVLEGENAALKETVRARDQTLALLRRQPKPQPTRAAAQEVRRDPGGGGREESTGGVTRPAAEAGTMQGNVATNPPTTLDPPTVRAEKLEQDDVAFPFTLVKAIAAVPEFLLNVHILGPKQLIISKN